MIAWMPLMNIDFRSFPTPILILSLISCTGVNGLAIAQDPSVQDRSIKNPFFRMDTRGPIARTAKRSVDPRVQPDHESISANRDQPASESLDQFMPRIDLGVIVYDATPRVGVIVEAISSGGPAAHAGLRPGDRLVALNHRVIRNVDSLSRELRRFKVSDQPTLQFVRDQRLHRVGLSLMVPEGGSVSKVGSLASRPDESRGIPSVISGRSASGLDQQAAAAANAVGQAVLGGIGAAFEQWFQEKPTSQNKADLGDSPSAAKKRTPTVDD